MVTNLKPGMVRNLKPAQAWAADGISYQSSRMERGSGHPGPEKFWSPFGQGPPLLSSLWHSTNFVNADKWPPPCLLPSALENTEGC